MNSRSRAREIALQYLYFYDCAHDLLGNSASDVDKHFEHFEVSPRVRDFARDLACGTLEHQIRIDDILQKHAEHWKLSRMSLVDRNLLRMASYELLYHADIPSSVTINEAVELAKRYGNQESAPFVNGVLDAIAKQSSIQ